MNSKQLIANNWQDMVDTLQQLIKYDTTKSKAQPNAPFGVGNRQCLDYVLNLANDMGFETYNCDGYAGHIDFVGSGKGVVGILGHLDVVPANQADGWIVPPFSGQIVDGKLYGRGTMDDKGPMVACLYAVKALKDSGYIPTKTIRLIFGCDEESGMQCMEYYFSKVPYPDVAFSPDGDFPVINREKGIYQHDINFGKLNDNILDISAGTRVNVVPNHACATLRGIYDITADGAEVVHDNGNTVVTTKGVNAHASTPQEGVNATWLLFDILAGIFDDDKVLQYISNRLCDYSGTKWGIASSDQHSVLTCNIGTVHYTDNQLVLGMDIRYPVTLCQADMVKLIQLNTPYSFVATHSAEPLFVPADSHLVSTLLDVYNKATNSNLEPLAIGGGTYSRCLPNCVAFGPLFPQEPQTIHMPNELIILDNYRTMAEIYLEAIYRLSL